MAGAEGLEAASQPLLRYPKSSHAPVGAADFDRCANGCSLYPPPAAVAAVARHAVLEWMLIGTSLTSSGDVEPFKENWWERPVRFDAILMMYQTESLQTVGSRCEMDARFEHQNGVKQTVRRAVKIQEKRLKPAWLSRFSLAERTRSNPNPNPTFQFRSD